MRVTRRLVTVAVSTVMSCIMLGSAAAADPAGQDDDVLRRNPIGETVPVVNINDFHGDARYDKYFKQKLLWSTCFKQGDIQHECASMLAPKNWYDPTMGDITVGLSRMLIDGKPLANPRLLLANPGGPGGPGAGFTGQMARLFGLTTTHTPIDVDPRGVGASTHLDCGEIPPSVGGVQGDSRGVSSKVAARAEKPWAEYFAQCKESSQDFLKYVNTDQTARDFNLVRAVMGFATADFFGISYGTWLGAYIGKAFPANFDRIVLDSNMDWQKSQQRQIQHDPGMVQEAADRVHLPWLARHHDQFGLGSSVTDVNATYEAIRTAASKGELGPIKPDLVDALLYSATVGDDLKNVGVRMSTLNKARLGDAQAKEKLAEMAQKASEPYPVEEDSTYNAVVCGDRPLYRNPNSWYWATAEAYIHLPLGLFMGGQVETCAHWPYDPALDQKVVDRPLKALLMHNEIDPNTPYVGLLETLKEAKGTLPLVFVDNAFGHGSLDFADAAAYATDYLGKGQLPAKDVVVHATPLPDEDVVYELKRPAKNTPPKYYMYGRRVLEMPKPAAQQPAKPTVQDTERQELLARIHETIARAQHR